MSLHELVECLTPTYKEETFITMLQSYKRDFHPSFFALVERLKIPFNIHHEVISHWILKADSQGYFRGLPHMCSIAQSCKHMKFAQREAIMSISYIAEDIKKHVLQDYI
jgi:hypothetical protein